MLYGKSRSPSNADYSVHRQSDAGIALGQVGRNTRRRSRESVVHLAKSAETLDAAREKVSAAIELAEQINKVACDAAAEIGASIPMSHD